MTTNKIIADLTADTLISTDEGTHGQPETIEIYQRLDGTCYGVRTRNGVKTTVPASTDSTHGRMRHLTYLSPAARREQIRAEQARIAANNKATSEQAALVEKLNAGWDGYRFIGVAAGQAKAAEMVR